MSKKLTTAIFCEKSRKIHGNKYDYSQIQYKTSWEKVKIICPKHGEFMQLPRDHLVGHGCFRCASQCKADKTRLSTKKFIEKAQKIHGNVYDYSKVDYTDSRRKVEISCPQHGPFYQVPTDHLGGHGCNACARAKLEKSLIYSTQEFISKANRIHGEKYNYLKTEYTDCRGIISICCPKHGDFKQVAYYHLAGNGCPKCGSTESKDEQAIYDFLISIGITDIQSRIRNIIPPKELDIYSPSHKIAIEYCGLYWHSDAQKSSNYHLDKLKACQEKGIRLITIFESDWKLKRLIVESRLRAIFGKTEQTIYARKTNIKELTSSEAREFFSQNHLQGNAPNQSVVYGLYHAGKLVSAMSFGKPRFSKNHEWEILRYASALNTSVVGSASKLYMHFVKRHNPSTVISYADLRWGKGDVYKNMGFSESGSSRPNYFYFKSPEIHLYSRIKFQKHRLPKILEDYNETLTEKQNMQNNGWFRIFDCGNVKFTWSTFPTQ